MRNFLIEDSNFLFEVLQIAVREFYQFWGSLFGKFTGDIFEQVDKSEIFPAWTEFITNTNTLAEQKIQILIVGSDFLDHGQERFLIGMMVEAVTKNLLQLVLCQMAVFAKGLDELDKSLV